MVEFSLEEEKKKCHSFQKFYTYVFVQTKTNFYNGYIVQILDEEFMFMDDEILQPFPIRWDLLKAPIVPSKKEGRDGRNRLD